MDKVAFVLFQCLQKSTIVDPVCPVQVVAYYVRHLWKESVELFCIGNRNTVLPNDLSLLFVSVLDFYRLVSVLSTHGNTPSVVLSNAVTMTFCYDYVLPSWQLLCNVCIVK